MTLAQTLRVQSVIAVYSLTWGEEYSSKMAHTYDCWPKALVPYLVGLPIGSLTMWFSPTLSELRGNPQGEQTHKRKSTAL